LPLDVLFVTVPTPEIELQGFNFSTRVDPIDRIIEPLGLGYLQACLKEAGYSAKIVDAYCGGFSYEQTIKTIEDYDSPIVGFSSSTMTKNQLFDLANMLKDPKFSQAKDYSIVTGGYLPTLEHERVVKEPGIDYAVRGEGEITIVELAKRLMAGEDAEGVLGVTYRHNGEVIVNPDRPLIQDIDSIPFPDRSDIAPIKYRSVSVSVYSSRGCYGKCEYCSIRDFYKGTWRIRSPENVSEEIHQILRDYPYVKGVFFPDDNFPLYNNRLKKLAELTEDLDIKFNFQSRPDDILKNSDSIIGLKDRIYYMSTGIESFSQSQLDRWGKGMSVDDNFEVINWMEKTGIPFGTSFISVDNEMTLGEIRESLVGIGRAKLWLYGHISSAMRYDFNKDFEKRVLEVAPKNTEWQKAYNYCLHVFDRDFRPNLVELYFERSDLKKEICNLAIDYFFVTSEIIDNVIERDVEVSNLQGIFPDVTDEFDKLLHPINPLYKRYDELMNKGEKN